MTESNPKISVILPVHNREHLASRAIDSILAQTFTDFELIIVDDASSDGTLALLNRYAETDARIKVIHSEQNLGASGARNRGIAAARGRYIAFQDSDDRWLPEKLAIQLEALEAAPECRAAYHGALYYSRDHQYYIPILDTPGRLNGDISKEILSRNPTTPQTLLLHRDIIAESGPFDEELKQKNDWDFAIRLAQLTKFVFIEEPLAIIYRTPNSVSSSKEKDVFYRHVLMEKYKELYKTDSSAVSHQYYVSGIHLMSIGRYGSAAGKFLASFRKQPRLRSVAKAAMAGLLSLTPGASRRTQT